MSNRPRTIIQQQENLIARFHGNTCQTNKLGYAKLRDAQSEASRLNKRRAPSGPDLIARAYRCWHCQQWQVGRPKYNLREGA